MPRRNNRNKNNNNNNKNKNKKKSKRKSKGYGLSPGARKIAAMLTNPCSAPLTPGLHTTDAGILSRFRSSLTPEDYDTDRQFGYCVWYPEYCASAALNDQGYSLGNCFTFVASTTSSTPINSVATPYGTGNASGSITASSVLVGANDFIRSHSCSDFRLLSACMKMSYTGSMTDSRGMIGAIQNFPIDTLLHGRGTGTVLDPPDIEEIYAMCANTCRLGVETKENIFTPGPSGETFRNENSRMLVIGDSGTSATRVGDAGRNQNPQGFGFCWVGVNPNDILLEFTQNIEWRPDAIGMVIQPAVVTSQSGHLMRIRAYLDTHYPGWKTTVGSTVRSAASRIAMEAFSGTALSYAPGLLL